MTSKLIVNSYFWRPVKLRIQFNQNIWLEFSYFIWRLWFSIALNFWSLNWGIHNCLWFTSLTEEGRSIVLKLTLIDINSSKAFVSIQQLDLIIYFCAIFLIPSPVFPQSKGRCAISLILSSVFKTGDNTKRN